MSISRFFRTITKSFFSQEEKNNTEEYQLLSQDYCIDLAAPLIPQNHRRNAQTAADFVYKLADILVSDTTLRTSESAAMQTALRSFASEVSAQQFSSVAMISNATLQIMIDTCDVLKDLAEKILDDRKAMAFASKRGLNAGSILEFHRRIHCMGEELGYLNQRSLSSVALVNYSLTGVLSRRRGALFNALTGP